MDIGDLMQFEQDLDDDEAPVFQQQELTPTQRTAYGCIVYGLFVYLPLAVVLYALIAIVFSH